MKYLLLFIITIILFSCQIKEKDYNVKVHTKVLHPNSKSSYLYGIMECDSATMINKNQVICWKDSIKTIIYADIILIENQ